MKNLRLVSKLQAADMVTLTLISGRAGKLLYYIVARSINYSIIVSGECDGELSGDQVSFNILLSSLYPMVDKGYTFRIEYKDEILEFVADKENIRLRPLYVEYNSEENTAAIGKCVRFIEAKSKHIDYRASLQKAEAEVQEAQRQYGEVSKMKLESAITSSNPFGDVDDLKPSEALENRVKKTKQALNELKQQSEVLKQVDLKAFKAIALAAARTREMISFCDSYAVLALKSTYILQKGECPAMSIQGSLFSTLINFSDEGVFYWFENGLVYSLEDPVGRTTVFMEKYLPNATIDGSIVTRGAVKEHYALSMKGILAITQIMKSKFPQITFDMGAMQVVLENDKGEIITTGFELEKTEHHDFKKMERGEFKGEFQMAKIAIPSEVQALLSLFRDKLEIYVKSRKIIFQSGSFYVVFGRS